MQGVRTVSATQLMSIAPPTIQRYVRNTSILFHELLSAPLLFTQDNRNENTQNQNHNINGQGTSTTDIRVETNKDKLDNEN